MSQLCGNVVQIASDKCTFVLSLHSRRHLKIHACYQMSHISLCKLISHGMKWKREREIVFVLWPEKEDSGRSVSQTKFKFSDAVDGAQLILFIMSGRITAVKLANQWVGVVF